MKNPKKIFKKKCFRFFQGFSGRVVWKTIRVGLPHRFPPIQSSGNQKLTNFVSTFIFFLVLLTPESMKIQHFPFFFQKQASKPCSNSRCRRELSDGTRNTSKDLNLTDLVTTQGRDFHFFQRHTIYAWETTSFTSKNHHPEKRKF